MSSIPPPVPHVKQFYTLEEVVKHFGLTEELLRQFIKDGFFPRAIKLSPRKLYYHYTDLPMLEWLLANRERFSGELPPEEPES